jgi:hypothetical protein
MPALTKIIRNGGITFAICGCFAVAAIVCYASWRGFTNLGNVVLALPSFVLAALFWKERSSPWLIYLCALSVAFGLYGTWEAIQRTLIHYRSTLSGLPQLAEIEFLLLVPPVLRLLLKAAKIKTCP